MVNNPKFLPINVKHPINPQAQAPANQNLGDSAPKSNKIDPSIRELDLSRLSLYPFKINLDWNEENEIDLSFFPNLTKLDCSNNNLSKLDLSHTPRLTELWCHNNRLHELDLSHTPELQLLHCGGNKLAEIDVSPVPELLRFFCYKNNEYFDTLPHRFWPLKTIEFQKF